MIKLYYILNPKTTKKILRVAGKPFSNFEQARQKALRLKQTPNYKYGVFVVTKLTKNKLKEALADKVLGTISYV